MIFFLGFMCGIAFLILLFEAINFAYRSKRTKTSLNCVSISINNFKTTGIIMATRIPIKQLAVTAFRIKNEDASTPDNPVYIDGVTFKGEQAEVADESIVTVSVDPQDGPDTAVLDVNAIAAGTTTIKFTVTANYVDPNTGSPVEKNYSVDLEVTVALDEAKTSLVVDLTLNGEPAPTV